MSINCLKNLGEGKYTLDAQLKKLTGDGFSAAKYFSAHKKTTAVPAGVLVHKKTGKEIFVPFSAGESEDLGPNSSLKCLVELERIARNVGARGGFPLHDYRTDRSKVSEKRLDMLVEFGLAERTGQKILADEISGSEIDEIQVTMLGMRVLEGYRLSKSKNFDSYKLLKSGSIPKTILVAAEIMREKGFVPPYQDMINVKTMIEKAPELMDAIYKKEGIKRDANYEVGTKIFENDLQKFCEKYSYCSENPSDDTLIPISADWNKEYGSQVKVVFYRETGEFLGEGVVGLKDASPENAKSIINNLVENQDILDKDFYKNGVFAIISDTDANRSDSINRAGFSRMIKPSDIERIRKVEVHQNLNNFAP